MDRTPGIRPRPSFWRQLDAAARLAFPFATTALLLILLAAPLSLPGQAELQPAVALSCVFFWSLYRPASMAPPVILLIGLLADMVGYAPLGVNVLVLLVAHGIAVRWRRVLTRQGFLLVWLVFSGIAAGAAALTWGITALLTFALLPPGPAVFQTALSAACYPILSTLFVRAHRGLAAPEEA